MENNRKAPPAEAGRVNMQQLYALLRGLKTSVDRLTLQVKQLRNEREGSAGE